MSRKTEAFTISVPPGTKEKLEAIASRLNILWGKKPSPSGLIVAIAQGNVEVGQSFSLTPEQVNSIQQATKALIDAGHLRDAEILAALALERGNLNSQQRQIIMQQVSQPNQAWRLEVDRHRQNHQPFHLLYCDSQGQNLTYTVRYAEISFEEKRFYLQMWCDETDDIKDTPYPELIHNRCLRFDRIQAILPITGTWRQEGLDSLEVHLHFCRGLVKAYEPRQNDIQDEVIGEVRQVVRRVTNPFWLVREVLRYGQDCAVISPDNVCEAVKQELLEMCRHYNLT
ncbi:helix-turn-helix transcriptional regulator [Microcoleus sp. FACHB-672]|uniref:helix-turn-helix transcriptional regulator n=1 Tax=Microcoleus sp. FACHB-672 TaxID=2692825 RepID=UPI001683CD41|nr:WYL domain-containing protein [Microcoleus sp. FACHB-672]MBD2042682.1 WYL domain-containing protein [Microcoleus sp. FACHB-672]